jgi:hypothetical protein
MFRFFCSLLKDKQYPCHLKHGYRGINGFLFYDLCYIAIMWCKNFNQMIKTHIKIIFTC